MSRRPWTKAEVSQLVQLRDQHRGYGGSAAIIAAMPSRTPRSIMAQIERLDAQRNARPSKGISQRICPCGSRVSNDEATDYRRCTSCRKAPPARTTARFLPG